MQVSEARWDDYYKYVLYQEKGEFNTRFTAWYTVGLLARNQGEDVENAKAAIDNMLVYLHLIPSRDERQDDS